MDKKLSRTLNVEYAFLHGSYWMYYGVIASFASVFLLDKGYTNGTIGMILAIGNVGAVVLQPLIADFVDRSKKVSIIGTTEIIGALLLLLTSSLLIFESKSAALTFVFITASALVAVVHPLLNTLNFKIEERGVHINFGVARSCGSLAYSIFCAILGTIVETYGVESIPISGIAVLAMLLGGLILINKHYSLNKKEKIEKSTTTYEKEDINLKVFVKRNKVFILVTVGVVGVFFSNATLNNFMMQIVTNVGGTSEDMGRVFSLMAALEIPTLVFFNNIKKHFKCTTLLKFASICFVIKIAICYFATSVTLIFISQFMQVFSFALFLPAMVYFIDESMDEGEAAKGQSLYTIMVTVATVLSSIAGGMILDVSGAKSLLLISTIVTGLGMLIILFTVDKVKRKKV